jgi:hypothetical protein
MMDFYLLFFQVGGVELLLPGNGLWFNFKPFKSIPYDTLSENHCH